MTLVAATAPAGAMALVAATGPATLVAAAGPATTAAGSDSLFQLLQFKTDVFHWYSPPFFFGRRQRAETPGRTSSKARENASLETIQSERQ